MGGHLMGVNLMGLHLMGMHLAGMNLMGVYLMGMHLMGMYLMSVDLMRVSHRRVPSGMLSCERKSCPQSRWVLGKTHHTPPYPESSQGALSGSYASLSSPAASEVALGLIPWGGCSTSPNSTPETRGDRRTPEAEATVYGSVRGRR